GPDAELAQHRLGRLVLLHVDEAMRESVAPRELAQSARVRGVARADNPEAGPETDQNRPPQQECAQDQVAEAGVLRYELPKLAHRHRQDLAGIARARSEGGRLAGAAACLREAEAWTVNAQRALMASASRT